ncbi:hypothetical protein Tco_0070750 [Tanacetum coccineum]
MILNSVQNGPLVWPSVVEEDGITRTKRYEELSVSEKLQADCDLKATNIILQGLPMDLYAIVNHHKVAKEIWDKVNLLMQGRKFSLQENECKLYDEFDKFSFVKGETLRVPFNQRNNPPQNPRVVYPPILDINHFRHFLVILENLYPMDDEPMWAADYVVAPTPGSAFTIPKTANEYAIKGNHLTLVKENQFDGRTKTDPHKHIHEFLGICDMFKYRDTENEAVHLMMFPLSLTGEAKTWLVKLNEGTIDTWDELHTTFIS